VPWTYISPAALLEPGSRTGVYRTGGDQLLVDADGHSRITIDDYAVALVDEIEQPQATGRRMTVAY
jgi:putative NADH-flavin reductase